MEQLFGAHFIVYVLVILRSAVYIRPVHSAAQFIVLLCSAVYVRSVHSAACAGCVGLVPSLSLSLLDFVRLHMVLIIIIVCLVCQFLGLLQC